MLQTLPKVYNLKGLDERNLAAFLSVKLFVENLRQGKKQYLTKQKAS